ncbi:MAG: HAMP domain-containing histidine kinase [Defluviitaleaceae bacterium]|nr:HAMP domain-containing histidine kinase [Defluviitaleaceae bacterium]
MKKTLLTAVKIISVPLGFFGALSFVRSISSGFNWYANRVYGNWFNFGTELSLIWLALCLGLFALAVWHTGTPKLQLPHHRFDFSVIVLLCGAGVYMCASMLRGLHPEIIFFTAIRTTMIMFPVIAYLLAVFVFGELLARLRDKQLLFTLYWLGFFKAYPPWRPVGFFAVLLLASQLYLLIFPLRVPTLFAICVLTYFAAFLQNLSKEYAKANEEKIRAERFKSELITNVSHDIKTPLTSIINYVDLLKNTVIQGQAADYIRVLDRKSTRLKILIDDLIEASKAGTGNLRVDKQEINLSELVGQVAGEFEDSFVCKELTLVLRQPDEPVFAYSDSRHLYRALENLFSNAAKYALGGTRVFAEITRIDDKTCFILQNTSERPVSLSDGEATEQFMRGDKSRQTDGSGLGLYITKSLIELMGGNLVINISGDLFRVDVFL